MGEVSLIFDITNSDQIHPAGMTRQGERQWVMTESPAVLMVGLDQSNLEAAQKINPINAMWDTEIALRSAGQKQKQCQYAEIAYQTAAGAILQPSYRLPLLLPLSVDGKLHHLVTHANDQLRPREAGGLRIVLLCPVGTLVEWRRTQFLESRYIEAAAAHIKP
jgi:hypothetical protein